MTATAEGTHRLTDEETGAIAEAVDRRAAWRIPAAEPAAQPASRTARTRAQ